MVIMHEEVSLPSQSEHSEHFSQIVGSLIEVAFVFIFESQHFPIVFLHRKLFAGIVAWVLLSSCCLLACRDGSEIFGCFALGLLQCCSLGATHFYYLLMLNYGNIIHLQRLNMKRNQERQRQFSATRLSYSRNNSFKDSQPSVSPSRISNPQQAQSKASISQQRHRALTLMCNNCFNKQVSTQKTHKNGSSNDPNSGQEWGLFKTDKNKNNIQNLQNQVKKVTQYNLHKIKENQKQKEQLKNQKQTILTDSYYFGEKSQSTAQITQNKRLELKRELEMQIAVARERRERQKRQIRDASPNFIIETEYSRNKRQMQGEQYKMTLLEQMNNNKYKKMRDEQLQKKENNNYDLPFVKDAEQKMQTYLKLKNATKQNIREQFKKKKEQEQSLRQKYQRERQAEQQSRLENEKHAREVNQKTEQMRRTIINSYLQDLRKQMQENQVRRQKQFEKISDEPTCTLIPQQNHNTGFGEACGCCSKEFPKNFLSPYLKPNQVAHD